MNALRYFRFREVNDSEGETWDFYVPLKPSQHERLSETVSDNDSYELSADGISEREVDQLIKNHPSSTSYIASINKCAPVKSIPKVTDWADDDPYYKGGPWKIISRNVLTEDFDMGDEE